ncbi:DUF433 domain-containing protein [Flavobacterium sp.]|uniref:DUF433 domain-containing protein n=1 Tax=Flavobacterium sp. TaxID=239 RepID=UPI0037521607
MKNLEFENNIEIGLGIFTVPDIASILNLKYSKVNSLLNEYWDKRFASIYGEKYSWKVHNSKAVSFHTLVEFYIFFQLKEVGVPTQKILDAHSELSKLFETAFPFASSKIISKMNCVGKRIVFEISENEIINLDSTKQLNLKFIKLFAQNLDFDKNNIANKFYPLGKSNSVIVDPEHQFGQPVIKNTNIYPQTIYNLHKAKESKKFIAESYEISLKQVNDAIDYCKSVA